MGRRTGIDGRELILSAALRLFAEHGIDAVSIRAVNREAGLGPASVHYHFGTKDALVDAVVETYGDSVIESTRQRASGLLGTTEPVTAHQLVTILAGPYLDLITAQRRDGAAWIRLVSQLLQSDPDYVVDQVSARLIWKATARAYPDASPSTIKRAIRMCLTLLASQLARIAADGRRAAAGDIDLLVDFLSGGLDATLRSDATDRSIHDTA